MERKKLLDKYFNVPTAFNFCFAKFITVVENKLIRSLFVALFFLFSSPGLVQAAGTLQFKSGFEGTTYISKLNRGENWIMGSDGSLGNWTALKNGTYNNLDWVKFSYAYLQGGQLDIVQDPAGGNNQVLRLQNTGTGFRSQWQLNQIGTYWNDDGLPNKFTQQFYRYRMYIPGNITKVPPYNSWSNWYMIWESHTWNVNSPPGGEQTRYGIYLQKNPNSSLWYFNVKQTRPEGCDTYEGPTSSCTVYWDNKSHQNIPVPFDQWFTLDIFFKYSEANNGRFFAAITKEGSPRQTIADFIGRTRYDLKLHDQMIFKLYHSTAYTSALGKTNQYYDDLEIWSDFPPGYFSSASPSPSTKPGDANNDGRVDGVDYVIWLTNYNLLKTGYTFGDFNNSGKVDGVDYVVWLTNYGK